MASSPAFAESSSENSIYWFTVLVLLGTIEVISTCAVQYYEKTQKDIVKSVPEKDGPDFRSL